MNRFRPFHYCFAAVTAAIITIVAVQASTIRTAAANKSGIVRALPKHPSSPHFRLAQIQDAETGTVRVIAIEKHNADSGHPSLTPSFCELKVDHLANSAIMYIEGQPVIPDSALVVFIADYGATPQRVVIDRDAFNKIYPLHDDKELWNLCQEAIDVNVAGT